MNVVYHEGQYYLYQPGSSYNRFNIVESHLWLIARYTAGNRVKLKEGSVIRFGRIPFKVTKLKLDLSENDDEEDGPGLIQRHENNKKSEQQTTSPFQT